MHYLPSDDVVDLSKERSRTLSNFDMVKPQLEEPNTEDKSEEEEEEEKPQEIDKNAAPAFSGKHFRAYFSSTRSSFSISEKSWRESSP
jgi:hypothetical protein